MCAFSLTLFKILPQTTKNYFVDNVNLWNIKYFGFWFVVITVCIANQPQWRNEGTSLVIFTFFLRNKLCWQNNFWNSRLINAFLSDAQKKKKIFFSVWGQNCSTSNRSFKITKTKNVFHLSHRMNKTIKNLAFWSVEIEQ